MYYLYNYAIGYTILYSLICLSCCAKQDNNYAKMQLMYDLLNSNHVQCCIYIIQEEGKGSAIQEIRAIRGKYYILTQVLANLQWGRQSTSVCIKCSW